MSVKQPDNKVVQEVLNAWRSAGRPRLYGFGPVVNLPDETFRRYITRYARTRGMLNADDETALTARPVKEKQVKAKPEPQVFSREAPAAKRYVITSAQNATPVSLPFLQSLLTYCDAHDAELIVIPLRYKNPTSVFTQADAENDWWAPELLPYLTDVRHDLGDALAILADIKVQPTAADPIAGFEVISGSRSCILGHPKVALRTVPVPSTALPKIVATTGSVTLPNYTDTRAGKVGAFHHVTAAAVVELHDGIFHLRHVHADSNGTFIDLESLYSPEGVEQAPPAEALIMGDTHVRFADPDVLDATVFGAHSIAAALQPKVLVWHDLLDFHSRNHHHRGDPFMAVAKALNIGGCADIVKDEVVEAFRLVQQAASVHPEIRHVFPSSNHNDALARWLREADWKADPVNAEFYLETALLMVRSLHMGEAGCKVDDPFVLWGQQLLGRLDAVFVPPGGSYMVHGIEVGSHGHVGPNGSRGSVKSQARIGMKSVIGHSHSPGIRDGAYQVGTSSRLNLEYVRGPSSWLHTHCVIYANGKRTLINIINGEWRAERKKIKKPRKGTKGRQ